MVVHRVITEDVESEQKTCAKCFNWHQKTQCLGVSEEMVEQLSEEYTFFKQRNNYWYMNLQVGSQNKVMGWGVEHRPVSKTGDYSHQQVMCEIHDLLQQWIAAKIVCCTCRQTISGKFNIEVFSCLKDQILRFWPEIANEWILHYVKSPETTTLVLCKILAHNVTTLLQSLRQPWTAFQDFVLFLCKERNLKALCIELIQVFSRSSSGVYILYNIYALILVQ